VVCEEVENYNRPEWTFSVVGAVKKGDETELTVISSGPKTVFTLVTGPDICLQGCSSWVATNTPLSKTVTLKLENLAVVALEREPGKVEVLIKAL